VALVFVFHFSFVKAKNVGLLRLGMKNIRNSPQSRRYARLVALIIERIDSGCASNPMQVLIRLTAPYAQFHGIGLKTLTLAQELC
jgi:hypothetical protein